MSLMSLIFEALVAVALVFAASLAWRLDRRLTALKSGQDGVRQAVAELAAATARAEASVRDLRSAGEEAGRDLERRIVSARAVSDELHLLAGGAGRRVAAETAAERDAPAPRVRRRAPPREPDPARETIGETLDPQTAHKLARLRNVR